MDSLSQYVTKIQSFAVTEKFKGANAKKTDAGHLAWKNSVAKSALGSCRTVKTER